MAELDSFEKIGDEIDPAAEFIAREQNVLAEIDNDLDFKVESNHVNNETTEMDQENGSNHLGDDMNQQETTPPELNNISNSNQVNQINGDREPFKEPEKIKKWREEQQQMLKAKDEEEAKKKKELAEQAKKELEEWYARYEEQLNKSKLINRNAEKEWIAERDAETPGQEWEKIARMCDFNPKASRNSKDTSRMRSILLQLKQQQAQSS